MNLEIAARWTAALRSGEYKQTTQKLCDSGGFCCLGVLSELYLATPGANLTRQDITTPDGDLVYTEYIFTNEEGSRVSKDSALPRPARDWAGLKDAMGGLGDTIVCDTPTNFEDEDCFNKSESLANLNDNGLTFAQIADVIDYVAADL